MVEVSHTGREGETSMYVCMCECRRVIDTGKREKSDSSPSLGSLILQTRKHFWKRILSFQTRS